MQKSQYFKNVGEYKYYYSCRFCFSTNLIQVIDFGLVPLAGGFIINENKSSLIDELFYPLIISFCSDCFLLQTNTVIEADKLFKNYFYYTSSIHTLTNHFKEVASLIEKEKKNHNFFVVEIGCNDASLIKTLLEKNISILGVDPASNIVKPLIANKLPILNEYFTDRTAKKIKKKIGKADVVFSSNTLAHIEDMHEVFKGIRILLKKNGMLIFEVHYLNSIINKMQFDMIYHEHQYYYSYLTLKKILMQYGLEIYDIKPIQIHAGSMRFFVKHIKNKQTSLSVNVINLEKEEIQHDFHKIETYYTYNRKMVKVKKQVRSFLLKLKKQGKRVIGYGASGRGTIVMNYCGLTSDLVEYVVDDAPAKIGSFIPGTHQKIYSSKKLYSKKRPDYVILFAWSFSDEILQKHTRYLKSGGKFVILLPKIKVIS